MNFGKKPEDDKASTTEFLYRYFAYSVLDAVRYAPISKDFQNGIKPIVPIVFSHGLSASY